jgi:hypothetical protein
VALFSITIAASLLPLLELGRTGVLLLEKQSKVAVPLFSSRSVGKIGSFQQEIKYAIENLDTFSESEIYIIPARLDDCQIPIEKLATTVCPLPVSSVPTTKSATSDAITIRTLVSVFLINMASLQ